MYIKLEDVKLKTNEVMEVGVVIAPDEKYADKVAPFLGHKPGNYKWHVERSVKEVLDDLETRFYIGQLNDEIICNIMTVEHRKTGILGHVFTRPDQRMKGACKGVMSPQMEDFRRRNGEILYLGTGYDSPPYHIYKSFGFYSVLPKSGFMRYDAMSDFDAKYFSPLKAHVREIKWHDWPTVNALTATLELEAAYLRSVAFRMYGVQNFEGGFLSFKRDIEEKRYREAKLLESENGAIAGFATLKSDEVWAGNVCLLDIFLHPNFYSDGIKLLESLEFPNGKTQCYADSNATQKRRLLESFGFETEAMLKDQLKDRNKDKTYDVILFSKNY